MIQNRLRLKDLDEMITSVQQGNTTVQHELLKTYQPFVARCVSEVCKRYIDKSDDEFSVGLVGFNEAMNHYTPAKGSFFSFAKVVVKRKVIDYIRMTSRRPQLPSLDDETDEHIGRMLEIEAAQARYDQEQDSWYRREEIKDFKQKLSAYHISFDDLIKVSPKHQHTRRTTVHVARLLHRDIELKMYVQKRKKLPIKALLSQVNLSKKTLERHRKYILAMFIVMDENFLYLKEYLKAVS